MNLMKIPIKYVIIFYGDNMRTIQKSYINEIVINKSQFITYLFRVDSIEEVNEHLANIRKKHYDATHNCYAYILGPNQDLQKASDDGEPQKTAGFPMLDVLKKQNLTNILAITTRYFGGIMLGAGGLIRAYSNSVSEALLTADIYETKDYMKLSISVSYSIYSQLESILKDVHILNTFYSDNVDLFIGVDPNTADDLITKISNASAGKAVISKIGIYQMEILIKHNEF